MLHGIALRYFVEVARTGSLAAASENLHVAVSAISRQISKLEQEVGTPLFERLPRGMVLTESGELLAAHARRSLLESDAVLGEMSAARALGGGVVKLGCTEGFTRAFLPRVMADHYASAPQVRFVLRSGTPAQVEHWVEMGEVDIGIAFATGDATRVRVEQSMEMPVCALLAPAHPLAAKDVLALEDLKAYPLVLLERGTTARQLFDWCCSARGLAIEPVLSSNNSSVLHAFASLAGAITLGSALSLVGLEDHSLIAKRIDEPVLNQRILWVMTMRERRLSPAIKGVLERLKAAVSQATL
ncbi:LysR family transcriptional regulator [Trinickia terrae]|uniref:LysR family transcriptional regulator n=1 Tax=Trinickia terrae TaxID=2571161 RepID=A0A4U1I5S3_9BURK|nr:LysR family transcriptional regulator [Trinickia terrae]TKC88696.1 LysR family transcriptional regulator [Trinickia terrae]